MTKIFDNPKQFGADALVGFTAAFSQYVQPVHGGVVRATASPASEVAVITGGGSGHYPAFAGWVGPGFAHGAACGNIFASPSASQIYSVAKHASDSKDIIFAFGNYAGDVLHFTEAGEQLEAEGYNVRVLTITDDIASAPGDRHLERRGIAGDLLVLKTLSGAASAGLSLAEVERIGRKANDRTITLGIALSGCTLPGAEAPLFTVPEGQYALGLGIHGEPGISTADIPTASELARKLVTDLLAQRRADTNEVVLLTNGLGGTKYEELFVVHGRVLAELAEQGITVRHQEVGEHVTSLDMAGLSVSLMFIDDELEQYWALPADTPAFRVGNIQAAGPRRIIEAEDNIVSLTAGAPESQAQALTAAGLLTKIAELCAAQENYLGDLDAIAGDGDHGQGMVLGSSGAVAAANTVAAQNGGAKDLLDAAGKAWAESAGGTSGALWGNALQVLARAFSNEQAASSEQILAGIVAAAQSFQIRGKASVGDKTMVDATAPFALALEQAIASSSPASTALALAAQAATQGAEATAQISAKKGRAKTHGDASLGHPDPGAISFALITQLLSSQLEQD